ncbi:COX15/CtaA family protein [Actinosynnema sp. NPDC020468]|uniref:COX15/CtaA family protein n=1 Tax=Actinosynnema sp. NPDC020468 TaxID=3154488 RepID=UPI0034105DCD
MINWVVRSHRGLALAAVVANVVIAVTGAVVRVTGSGLGCPEWPNCLPGSMVPVEHPGLAMVNQWIEYGNRLLAAGVGVIGGLCLVAAWYARPRRPVVVVLSATVLGGVLAQAVIGGITVKAGLLWWTVAFHFLVSPVLAWFAVVLVHAVGAEPRRARSVRSGWYLVVLFAGALVTGTLVTAAGPHAGDAGTPRLDLPVEVLARVHSFFLFAFVPALVWQGVRARWSPPFRRLAAAVVAQVAVGFTQYFTGVPAVLVVAHVLGAMLVVVALANVWCAYVYAPTARDSVVSAETGSSR